MSQELLEFSEALLDNLEKAALELDAKDAQLVALHRELVSVKAEKVASAPVVDWDLITLLAARLESEDMLMEGLNAEKAASLLGSNPNHLVKLALTLVTPVTEGKAILTTKQSSAETSESLVEFNGRKFKDPDGFLSVLRG